MKTTLLGLGQPSEAASPADLQRWREDTFQLMNRLFLVISPLMIIPAMIGAVMQGRATYALLLALSYGTAALLVRAQQLAYNLRVAISLGIWGMVATGMLLEAGLVGSGRLLFCVIPIFATVLIGRRAALTVGFGAMLLMLAIFGGIMLGGIPQAADLALRVVSPISLLTNALVTACVTALAVVIVLALMGRLAGSLRAAEQANANLAMILRMLPDLFWFKDAQGRYQFVSDAFCTFHGRSPDEVIGKVAGEIFPAPLAAGIEAGDRKTIAVASRYLNESPVASRSGQLTWLDTIKTPVYDSDGQLTGILGISHDITARKVAQDELARQLRYADALFSCSRALLSPGGSDATYREALAQALHILRAAVEADRIAVFQYPSWEQGDVSRSNEYRMLGASYGPDLPPQRVPTTAELANRPPELRALMMRGVGFNGPLAGRFADYPAYQRYLDDNQIRSAFFYPLAVRGRSWGHLSVTDHCRAHQWDEASAQMLRIAGEMITTFVQGWEAEKALLLAKDAAESADRAKSAFLASMSHEIRTPLNAVIGMAELLAGTSLSPQQREYVATIRVGGEALLGVIANILDFSKIESGQLELEEQPFDLYACLTDTINLLAHDAAQKNLALRCHIEAAVPRAVVGDGPRLRQVLVNLLANAVKFTERGEVTLSVAARPMGGGQSELLLAVRDTGIGIDPERLDQIFEPFAQADSSISRRYGGTGLGLTICRQLVSLMGGKIRVTSAPGTGSTFTVSLLAWPADLGMAQGPALSSAAGALTRGEAALRVLVAEDNLINQKVTLHLLARLGVTAEVVCSGAAAVAAVRDHPYDLVLMDMHMPELDGVEATCAIRALGRQIHQPQIVALTADALSEQRDQALRAGMDGYLCKPVRIDDLQRALLATGQALAAGQGRSPLNWGMQSELIDALDLPGPTGAAAVRQLLDHEIGRQIADLEQALAHADLSALAERAHRLRGGLSQLGAAQLAELSAQIERGAPAGDLAALAAQVAVLRQRYDETRQSFSMRYGL